MSLMQKKEMFRLGVGIFAQQHCQGDQGLYTTAMVHRDGYIQAAKKFYETSGYLKKREREALYNKNVLPDWMKDCFMQVEQQLFNQTIWDKQ